MKHKQLPDKIISARISYELYMILKKFSTKTLINVGDVIELALLDFVSKKEFADIKYNGINLQELAHYKKLEISRTMLGIKRNDLLSGELLILRMRHDIYMLLSSTKYKEKKEIKSSILDYIELREREAVHFNNSKEILKQISFFKERLNIHVDHLKMYLEHEQTKYIGNGHKPNQI